MQQKIASLFLAVGLLGSGFSWFWGAQQISVPLVIVVLWFGCALVSRRFVQLPAIAIKSYGYFVILTIPGTLWFAYNNLSSYIILIQYAGILIFWLVMWDVFRCFRYSARLLISVYLNCALIAAFVGILQQVCYLLGVIWIYDLHWLIIGLGPLDESGGILRAYSVFTEPSYFASFLMPAAYLSILSMAGTCNYLSKINGTAIIVAILLSFSAIGYVGLIVCLFFSMSQNRKNAILLAILISIIIPLSAMNPAIHSRIDSLESVMRNGLSGNENLSVVVNVINLHIASDIVIDHFITGIGLGAYREYSPLYLQNILDQDKLLGNNLLGMERELTLTDGGSMYFRLPSEIGILSCFIILFGILNILRKLWRNNINFNIGIAAIVYILTFSIRSGQIIRFELLFFTALLIMAANSPLLFGSARKEGVDIIK